MTDEPSTEQLKLELAEALRRGDLPIMVEIVTAELLRRETLARYANGSITHRLVYASWVIASRV
jgi:hypothetical protein